MALKPSRGKLAVGETVILMERIGVIVFTLLLSTTSAYAAGDDGNTGRHSSGQASVRQGFHGDPRVARSSRTLAPRAAAPSIRVADGSAKFETTLWKTVTASDDPADYEAYLALFPNGRFAAQAREALARLRKTKSTGVPNKSRAITRPRAEKMERIDSTYMVRTTANLRSAPGIEAAIVGRAETGEMLYVIGRPIGKNWYKVSTGTGTVAYIAAGLVSKPEPRPQAPAAGPRAAPPPTPKAPSSGERAVAPPPRQAPPARKSAADIKRDWNKRIDAIKESGPHGSCTLWVGDKWEYPVEYDACEDRNAKIKSLQSQMERDLAGQR